MGRASAMEAVPGMMHTAYGTVYGVQMQRRDPACFRNRNYTPTPTPTPDAAAAPTGMSYEDYVQDFLRQHPEQRQHFVHRLPQQPQQQQQQQQLPRVEQARPAAAARVVPVPRRRPAPLWRRVLAELLDLILVSFLVAWWHHDRLHKELLDIEQRLDMDLDLVDLVLIQTMQQLKGSNKFHLFATYFGFMALYNLLFGLLVAATPGKLVCFLRIERVLDGGPPGWFAHCLRSTLKAFALVFLFGFAVVELLLWHDRRAHYDRLARTRVVCR